MKTSHELIVTILNKGFSAAAVLAAQKAGASGGTIIHGRGTASAESEKFFGMDIHPEKEVLLIVTPSEGKEAIMQAIMQEAGLGTKAHGFVFTLPVDHAVGLRNIEAE